MRRVVSRVPSYLGTQSYKGHPLPQRPVRPKPHAGFRVLFVSVDFLVPVDEVMTVAIEGSPARMENWWSKGRDDSVLVLLSMGY